MSTPRFHALPIREIRRETPDAVSIAFAVPEDLAGAYRFEQGQYLTLRAVIEGEDLRRSYSICTGEDEGELRVAIKEVEGGAFSTFANRALQPGATLEVMTPMGRFGVASREGKGGHLVFFAAGSGITPILSIIRTRLAKDPDCRLTLFYGNRNSAGILFREQLEDLKDRHLGRLSVHHILSREAQDIDLLNGRMTPEKIALLVKTLGGIEAIDDVYLCGPAEMIAGAKAVLAELGASPERIHVELFTSNAPRLAGAKPKPAGSAAKGIPLSLTHDGQSHAISLQPGETVLEAAERAGLDVPYSCRGGMCCTCRAKVTDGDAAMDVNFSLEPWEVEAGYVLACQCRPTGDRLSVDFDQM
ncbi:MAG: phenylacetate-CoA oxygenase/reductase subunit PaaK [Beijerinckiaceae bacterium]|nr:phenylacetate-CoA oxygenase/reductase subunit PaaK [Beijerinckiaceae bacterium]MCZ8301745.1 phenylacetate-CoA oxygenase/reductase subunit PaaK [Beijerinckiaceae bacterium]